MCGRPSGSVRWGAADAGKADEFVAGGIAAAVRWRPVLLGAASAAWHTGRMVGGDKPSERETSQGPDSVPPMTEDDRRMDASIKAATARAIESSRQLLERCELFLAELPWGKKS